MKMKKFWCITFILVMCTLTGGCGNKNTSNIPTLEEMSMMSGEEAAECLQGLSREELIDAWGEASGAYTSGIMSDYWTGTYGKIVVVFYYMPLDPEAQGSDSPVIEDVSILYDVCVTSLDASDRDVDRFLKLLGEYDTGCEDDICYNVTWDSLSEHFGFEVFKFEKSRAGFLLYEDNVYELESWSGFEGITYLAAGDLNGDGYSELYYTLVDGSGMAYPGVGYFDTATKENTEFTMAGHGYMSLCLVPSGDGIDVYTAEFEFNQSVVDNRLESRGEKIAVISCSGGEIMVEETAEIRDIPQLKDVATMSDEEATECLKGCSSEELVEEWGEPAICFMGLPGERWLIEEYEKEVPVGYNCGADSEEDLIAISVRISDVDTTTLYE